MTRPEKRTIYVPIVRWDCGNPKHRHRTKDYAQSCIDHKLACAKAKKKRAEKKVRDKILMQQRAELEFKRFQKKCIADLTATGNMKAVENMKEFFNVSRT